MYGSSVPRTEIRVSEEPGTGTDNFWNREPKIRFQNITFGLVFGPLQTDWYSHFNTGLGTRGSHGVWAIFWHGGMGGLACRAKNSIDPDFFKWP